MKYAVTGGAGFIGSHLVDALLEDPATSHVRVVDNFSSGRREYLAAHTRDRRLRIVEADLLDRDAIGAALADARADLVYHLSANPDARWGLENTRLDLDQETVATYNVLEAMRQADCGRVILASSGAVYGNAGSAVVNESYGPCMPISLYAAGKLAAEALVSAFCGSFGLSAVILRFGNIAGERTTHGVMYDFVRKLCDDPATLQVLGNGTQSKPYVYVRDLVRGLRHAESMLLAFESHRCDVFNVAPHGATSVKYIAEQLIAQLGLRGVTIRYGERPEGWPGDVPQSRMDASKLRAGGFQLTRTSDQAAADAIAAIVAWLRESGGDFEGLKLPREGS